MFSRVSSRTSRFESVPVRPRLPVFRHRSIIIVLLAVSVVNSMTTRPPTTLIRSIFETVVLL